MLIDTDFRDWPFSRLQIFLPGAASKIWALCWVFPFHRDLISGCQWFNWPELNAPGQRQALPSLLFSKFQVKWPEGESTPKWPGSALHECRGHCVPS